MKTLKRIVLGAALLGAGCFTLPTDKSDPAPQPLRAVAEAPPPPAVMPEQVNDRNARAMASALAQELDYAAHEHPAAKTPRAAEE
jgi:hypothetical protein